MLHRKKIIIILASILSAIFIIISAGLLFFYLPVSSKEGTAIQTKYHLTEDGKFVANIPIEDYLYSPAEIVGDTFYISSFGASIDNNFIDNATGIQDAIDAAFINGGGTVVVDGGKYKTGKIKLKSNVTLRINQGSTLECITFDENKTLNESDRFDELGFISAENSDNITIEGPGKISGNGETYVNEAKDNSPFLPLDTFNLKTYIVEHRKRIMFGKEHEFKRAILLGMKNCTNVTIRNIELYEAATWTARLEGTTNLLIEDVVINNNIRVANTDGFDIEGGTNITIRHCFIAAGDDAICIKTSSSETPPLDGMLVENCEVMSLANCFKIGTATWNDVSNVIVRNCFFFMSGVAGGYSGIAIEATDGGNISNITVDNIVMESITAPFVIWLGYRHMSSSLKNITISNITATGCDIASAITGYKKIGETKYVENVTLKNITVAYREANEKINTFKNTQGAYQGIANMKGYPEITRVSHIPLASPSSSGYFDLPVYGLFARYVDGLNVENFVVIPRSQNKREMNNVQDETKRIDVKNVNWV